MSKKVSELPTDTTPTGTDYVVVLDVETNTLKRVKISDLFSQALIGSTGLADLAVSTAKIATNAVTKATQVWNNLSAGSQSITSTSFVDVTYCTGTLVTTGGDLLFTGTFSGYTNAINTSLDYKLLIGSTDLPNSTGFHFFMNPNGYHTNIPIMYVMTGIVAGTYTVKAQLKVNANTFQTDTNDRANLTVVELKK
jgi:hypothetical protein